MKTQTNLNYSAMQEIASEAIEKLNSGYTCYGCDLHNELFNQDYYIIGRYQAEQWLISNIGIFAAIDNIKEYEEFNFGEVNIDLSESEHVVNMIVYIAGEDILQSSEHLQKVWGMQLTNKDCKKIASQIKKEYSL